MSATKFANVPSELRNSVRNMPAELANTKFRYGAAAGLVVKYYLGNALARPQARTLLLDANDWRFSARVNEIGTNLFQLRSEPGFKEICRRLREGGRDIASVHCELASAMKMKHLGFDVYAQPERRVKGDDFDFWAMRGSTRVNCEVTFLRGAEFTRSNVLNRLRKKVPQLPTGTPALIDCYWPADRWTNGHPEQFEAELFDLSQEFFRRTGRINYILFSREKFITKPGGGAILISTQTCWNTDPREKSSDLDAAMRTAPPNHRAISKLLETNTNHTRGFGEFVGWVDAVLAR